MKRLLMTVAAIGLLSGAIFASSATTAEAGDSCCGSCAPDDTRCGSCQ